MKKINQDQLKQKVSNKLKALSYPDEKVEVMVQNMSSFWQKDMPLYDKTIHNNKITTICFYVIYIAFIVFSFYGIKIAELFLSYMIVAINIFICISCFSFAILVAVPEYVIALLNNNKKIYSLNNVVKWVEDKKSYSIWNLLSLCILIGLAALQYTWFAIFFLLSMFLTDFMRKKSQFDIEKNLDSLVH